MREKFVNRKIAVLAAGWMLLFVSACSKEKEEAAKPAATPAPAAEQAPAPAEKEPAAATPAAPAEASAKPAPQPAAAGAATSVRARFDGYANRVSKSLWQAVPLAEKPANFALIAPLESVAPASGLVVEGGPENLALGTASGMLKTADGRPLVAGQEYSFAFRKAEGDVWAVEITAAR